MISSEIGKLSKRRYVVVVGFYCNYHCKVITMNEAEQQWVEQARQGDRAAFSRLVEAYQRPVYNLTYRMLSHPEEAEDAAQETFLRAFSSLKQYNPEHKFSTWIFSIANHHCIDRLRKRRVTWVSIEDNPVLENLAGDGPQPEARAVSAEERAEVQLLLDQLEVDYRMPLILRYWEGCSYEEIAETLGISIAAVKSRLFRGRQQLARLVQDNERLPAPPELGARHSLRGQATKAQQKEQTEHRSTLSMRFAWF
jgi:RNA polymerase sigma-70 factor, ECF subfamily